MNKIKFFLLASLFSATALSLSSCGDDEPDVKLPENINLSTTELSLLPGESAQLTAHVYPADATDKTVLWSVDGTGVSVDDTGIVTATGTEGSATVTATAKANTAVKATCIVKVGESKKNQWKINGTPFEVRNVAFWRAAVGYELLFCDKNVEIFPYMPQPDCNWLRIDFPDDIVDNVISNPNKLWRSGWDFEYQTNIENPQSGWLPDKILLCDVSIKRVGDILNPLFNIDMTLTFTNGDKFSLNYEGKPLKCDDRIAMPSEFLYNQWWTTEGKYYVKSAGIFHGNGGYNLLITNNPTLEYHGDMSQPVSAEGQPYGWVRVDFPEEIVNKAINAASELDGSSWEFYFQTNDYSPKAILKSDKIYNVKCEIRRLDGGKWKINLFLQVTIGSTGKSFNMSADIDPAVVSYYITSSAFWLS